MKKLVKLLCILLFPLSCFAAGASDGYDVSLTMRSAPLRKLAPAVTAQTGIAFSYGKSLGVLVCQKAEISLRNASVPEIAGAIGALYGLDFEIRGDMVVFLPGAQPEKNHAGPLPAPGKDSEKSDDIRVFGTVRDGNGGPLPGAGVLIKGTTTGVATDLDGQFAFEVPAGSVLVFSCLGFIDQEIRVNTSREMTVVMRDDSLLLDDVVVVGYGSQSREKLTTAVSKLDSKALENTTYTHVASALQGEIPGLIIQSTTGQPGSAPSVILRGGTSINNPGGSTPLYVVDGVIREDINHIAAEDIASMQVLKDAAATAIYGARASNGVVLVTTKTGREGDMRLAFSYDFSIAQEPRQLDLVTAEEYIVGGRQSVIWAGEKTPDLLARLGQAVGFGTGNDLTNLTAFTTMYLTDENAYKLDEGWKSVTDPYDPQKTIIYKETDYQRLRRRTAYSHNYHLAASGGGAKATYNVSLGYLDGEGTALTSDYKRLSLTMNGRLQLTDRLSVTGRMNFFRVSSHAQTNYYNTFTRSAALPSTAKLYFEDGSIAPGINSSLGNPLYYQTGPNAARRQTITTSHTISLNASYKILDGLSIEPQASYFANGSRFNYFQPGYLSSVSTYDESRPVTTNSSETARWQINTVLSYEKDFGAHHMDAKLGYEYFQRQYWTFEAQGKGAATDNIPTLNAAAEPRDVTGYVSDFVTEGMFGRVNYDFDGRYLLSFNFRYDGASSLGSANRTGFFPGVSLGWNLHRETFWKRVLPERIMRLKLRLSYGANGNIQGLNDFTAQGLFDASSRYNGQAAIRPSTIPNEALSWEKSHTFNIGADMGLFDGRISMLFDAYDRLTTDLLADVTLPQSSGYSSVKTNNGSLRNRGVELGLTAHVLPASSPLQWTSVFNISKVSTRIVSLPDNGVERNRQGGYYVYVPSEGQYMWLGGLQEGGRVGDMFALHYVGVYATDEEASEGPTNTYIRTSDKRSFAGDARYLDLDGDGDIDSNDLYCVGNQYPTVSGGFNNTLTWKNLTLQVRTDFTLGHTIFSYTTHFLDGQMQGDCMPTAEYYRNSWKVPGDKAKYPRYLWQDQQYNMGEHSDLFFFKGDFLSIREVSLAWKIPQAWTRKVSLQNLRVNLTGNNLYYFTAYKGLNPEGGGRDEGRYPNPRTVSLGVQATF